MLCVSLDLPKKKKVKWLKYWYRKYTKEGDAAFGDWIVSHEWSEITGTPSQMAQALGMTLDWAMRTFFPLITHRLRSDQNPWIDRNLERMIERRKKIFRIQGRSRSWKKVKKKTEEIIRDRKRGYLNYQVEKAVEKGGLGNCFAALTKPLQTIDKKPNFDVRTLCSAGASDLKVSEECADFFSAISDEFTPLDLSLIHI